MYIRLLCYLALVAGGSIQPCMGQPQAFGRGSSLLGSATAGTGLRASDPVTGEPIRYTHLSVQPRIGVFATPQLLLAVQGEYGWVRFNIAADQEAWGIGYLARWYLRFPGRVPVSSDKRAQFAQGARAFAELGHHLASRYSIGDSLAVLSAPRIHALQAGVGLDLRIAGSLYLELTGMYEFRPQRSYPAQSPIGVRVGLDYFIHPRHD
ncbi:MAG: hypothetical protein OHK0039_12940 [Bacteroidia bacterium]